jgi:hypothetical protein
MERRVNTFRAESLQIELINFLNFSAPDPHLADSLCQTKVSDAGK